MGIEALPDGQSGRTLVAVTGGPFLCTAERLDVGILHILDKHVPIHEQCAQTFVGVAAVGGKLCEAVDLHNLGEPADVIAECLGRESCISVA